jgi:hypothetical protein
VTKNTFNEFTEEKEIMWNDRIFCRLPEVRIELNSEFNDNSTF